MAKRSDIERLWALNEEQIRRSVASILEGVPDCDVDDACQETFKRVLESYDPDRGEFAAFCKRIARNWALDRLKAYIKRNAAINQGPNPLAGVPKAPIAPLDLHRLEFAARTLRLTFDGSLPPHQVIAFGFVKLLGLKPMEIVPEYLNVELAQLGALLVDEYRERSELPPPFIRSMFTPFLIALTQKGRTGKELFCDSFTSRSTKAQQAQVTTWSNWIQRIVLRKLLVNVTDILESIAHTLHPHEFIAYACIDLLGWTPDQVILTHSQKPLLELAGAIEKRCLVMAPHRQQAVLETFERFRQQRLGASAREVLARKEDEVRYKNLLVRDPVLGSTVLEDYYGHPKPASAAGAVATWKNACKRDLMEWRDLGKRRVREWIHG